MRLLLRLMFFFIVIQGVWLSNHEWLDVYLVIAKGNKNNMFTCNYNRFCIEIYIELLIDTKPVMKVNQYSQSTKIYLQQIVNHVEKGEGYSVLRKHLLKQLNQCHSQNIQADQSLVPALIQRLSHSLLSEDHQKVSRTIDILQDLIKHAENIICQAFNNSDFCLTLSVCIQHKKIITFSRQLIIRNKERLASILIFLFKKFQYDPVRYSHIVTTYKTLKQKQCQFPKDTFIIIPKVNDFIEQKVQKQQQKIGVTFDSIINFVNSCEQKFNLNKNQCANTQFVRSLKVKAKTLYDLSQSQGSIQLEKQQKQQAKILYKKLRTMLKQLQKINQTNIKLKKIKQEQQFIANKIENLTPKKEEISPVKSNKSKDTVVSLKKQTQLDLLNINEQVENTKQQQAFGQYQQNQPAQKQASSGKKSLDQASSGKKSVKQTPKKLRKPPAQQKSQTYTAQNANLLQTQDYQIQINQNLSNKSGSNNKPNIFDEEPLVQTNNSLKKSTHSYRSCDSDKIIKNQDAKSNNSDIQFDNANNFSKFQVLNRIVEPNKYSMIPNDLNLTPSSQSKSQHDEGRVTFDNNNTQIFQNSEERYNIFNTPKKIQSSKESQWKLSQQKTPKSVKVNSQRQKYQLQPNQNFGVLLDNKVVQAYDYSALIIAHSPSKISHQSEQTEIKIQNSPPKQEQLDFTEYIASNSQKKIQVKNEDFDDLLI